VIKTAKESEKVFREGEFKCWLGMSQRSEAIKTCFLRRRFVECIISDLDWTRLTSCGLYGILVRFGERWTVNKTGAEPLATLTQILNKICIKILIEI
jgi:hypothetical protein